MKPRTPKGAAAAWLALHKDFKSDECLFWPFGCSSSGHAKIKHERKDVPVCRIICKYRHGPPPTPKHEAAHSCGNGHLACVNPQHVDWKTSKENHADQLIHGTSNRGQNNGWAKLTEAKVLAIRSINCLSQRKIAKQYGISAGTVASIKTRRTWAWL